MQPQTFTLIEVNSETDLPPAGEKVIVVFERFVNYLAYRPEDKERWLRGGLKWMKKN